MASAKPIQSSHQLSGSRSSETPQTTYRSYDGPASDASTGVTEPSNPLIWAKHGIYDSSCNGVFFGVGCTSAEGLPLDSLAMMLAAVQTELVSIERPMIGLVADFHCGLGQQSISRQEIYRRAKQRGADLLAIGAAMRQPMQIDFASDIVKDHNYVSIAQSLAEDLAKVQFTDFAIYNRQSCIDALYYASDGRMKIGWTRHPQSKLHNGNGRSDEYNGTDKMLPAIGQNVYSMYVRHGFSIDARFPVCVPYSVHREGVESRLMLTGDKRGGFKEKLVDVKPSRRNKITSQIERIVKSWESVVDELDGFDAIEKAETIVDLVGSR